VLHSLVTIKTTTTIITNTTDNYIHVTSLTVSPKCGINNEGTAKYDQPITFPVGLFNVYMYGNMHMAN